MTFTVPQTADSRQRLLPEKADQMASADLRKAETPDRLREIGVALDEARHTLRWSLKELAREIEKATGKKRDERQVARWIEGTERQQLDVLIAVRPLKPLFLIALARADSEIEVETTIRIRRSA